MKRRLLPLSSLLVWLSFACPLWAGPVNVTSLQQPILGTPSGRYMFGQISDSRSDQFMLDIETGRLWVIEFDAKGNRRLKPVPFVQLYGEEANVPEPLDRENQYRDELRNKTLKETKSR
ncbi:hypothetical protein [Spongorhabdus nitratireducens]